MSLGPAGTQVTVGVGSSGPDGGTPVTALASPVETALSRLDDLEQMPVSEHVAVFDDVHRRLQDVLATLDEV